MTESQRTPPDLYLVSHPTSPVVHASYREDETLCHVTTWGEYHRHDGYPEKRLCRNCTLMLEKRPFWRQTAFADAWLEHKRTTAGA